jgi:hypothetical protein
VVPASTYAAAFATSLFPAVIFQVLSITRCFRHLLLLASVIAAVLATGCGSKDFAPVTGTVTLDGQPLPRGMVQFVPINDMPTSTGEIGPDGKFRLKTAERDGAYVGKHKVRLDAREIAKDHTVTAPPSLIPERYMSEATSKLEFEVVAGKTNVIDVKLTSP